MTDIIQTCYEMLNLLILLTASLAMRMILQNISKRVVVEFQVMYISTSNISPCMFFLEKFHKLCQAVFGICES